MSKAEEDVDEKKIVKRKDKAVILTKVVIRRLPSTLTEESFLELFNPLPKNDFFRFVHGDRTLAPYNFCRAYINFSNPEEILSFRDKYDGQAIEKNGQSSICVVEYAPYTKIGHRLRRKEDQKSDTILQDPDYKKFMESLEQVEQKEILDVEQYLDELESREKNNEAVDTPLTNYLKQRREEKKRVREERRRMENERRKKRDEEKRKKKEAEKKKRLEASKAKKNESASRNDYDGKKTLAETRPSTSGKNAADGNENVEETKVKILQKETKESARFTPKSFQEKPRETSRFKQSGRDNSKESSATESKRNDKAENSDATTTAEPRFKNTKEPYKRPPQRTFYRGPPPRGGSRGDRREEGSAGGPKSSTPHKYSEQRSGRSSRSKNYNNNYGNGGDEW